LRHLNCTIIRFDRYSRNEDHKKHLVPFEKNIESLEKKLQKFSAEKNSAHKKPEKDYEEILKLILHLYPDEEESHPIEKDLTPRAQIIFEERRSSIIPVYGSGKANKAFHNQYLVIGAKIELKKNSSLSYRVDYDPKKELHINLDIKLNGEEFSFALKVAPETKFYFVNKPQEKDEKAANSKQQEMIKYKFFTKMTLGFLLNRSKANLKNQSTSESENNEIIYFFQGKDYNADLVKKCILTYYTSKYTEENGNIEKSLNECNTNTEILTLLNKDHKLRNSALQSLINAYGEKKPKDKKSSNLVASKLEDDSEKQPPEDSDQPPTKKKDEEMKTNKKETNLSFFSTTDKKTEKQGKTDNSKEKAPKVNT